MITKFVSNVVRKNYLSSIACCVVPYIVVYNLDSTAEL